MRRLSGSQGAELGDVIVKDRGPKMANNPLLTGVATTIIIILISIGLYAYVLSLVPRF